MSEIIAITEAIVEQVPEGVSDLLSGPSKAAGLERLLQHLLLAIRSIAGSLRFGEASHDTIGTQNAFGDHQLHVDVVTDEVIMNMLRASGLVHVASSEESPVEVNCSGVGYSVAFDPLDGSSIIDANFAVGTIIGVFPGNGLLGRCGRELSLSLVAIYGPRVTIALALNGSCTTTGESISLELTMQRENWSISNPKFSISPKGKTFAPGNLRATADNSAYNALVMYWIANKYTLRYSGGLVPDVYHILIKGEGVLSNASSPKAKAKLRLLYEAIPIALIIEAAGGGSCVCPCEAGLSVEPVSLLEVPVSDLDKRVGVCYGSTDEVQRFKSYIFGTTA